MLERVNDSMVRWAESIAGDTAVSQEPPNDEPGKAVNVYLMDLVLNSADDPVNVGDIESAPLRYHARYLVTTSLGSSKSTRQLLENLAFAALENPDFKVDTESLTGMNWLALGAVPRPCLVIQVPLRGDVAAPPAVGSAAPAATAAEEPPVVVDDLDGVTVLNGLVVNDEGEGMPGVRVEMPAIGTSARTDNRGRFRFESVPTFPEKKRLLIVASGRVFQIEAVLPDDPDEAVTVQLTGV